ncbi:hypothetical protein Trydic_g14812, partial [Trypoxylus dichotomus]
MDLLVIGPDEPTHIHEVSNTTDVLDIAVVKNLTAQISLEVLHDPSSDHLPILARID